MTRGVPGPGLPGLPDSDPRHEEAIAVLRGMYEAYQRGDTAAIDAVLSPELTIFDSVHADIIVGLDELNEVRSQRGSGEGSGSGAVETAVTMVAPQAFDKGDGILVVYWLRVDYADAHGDRLEPELSRTTAWMRLEGGSWKIVHIHEDVWAPMRPAHQGRTG